VRCEHPGRITDFPGLRDKHGTPVDPRRPFIVDRGAGVALLLGALGSSKERPTYAR
jgi:hypothetical protein